MGNGHRTGDVILLYPHGGSGNHGCEAIVRSTGRILEKNGIDREVILYSLDPEEDKGYGLDQAVQIRRQNVSLKRFSFDYARALYLRYLRNERDGFDQVAFKDMLQERDGHPLALSIGGDNYCYGKPEQIYFMNRHLRKQGVKTVLWGCSVEAGNIDEEMEQDLRGYDLIVTRESLSYAALSKINPNVSLCPDSAFLLEAVKKPLPEGFLEGNTIGINVSPMVIGYEKESGATMANFVHLMEHILSSTDMNIALIPHVVWKQSNDLEPLLVLYERFRPSGRVVLIGDGNCMELKGFISRCRMFIGARTHATIAAYSTCVPTLVVGYSVKAKGIARDIFGSEENMVIPVQTLKDRDGLIRAFEYLKQNEERIRRQLEDTMPGYLERAMDSGEVLSRLVDDL